MSVEAETAPPTKKAMKKKHPTPGTFNVEHPKKVKKDVKGVASKDKFGMKKNPMVKKELAHESENGSTQKRKKRPLESENNGEVSPSKKFKPSSKFPKGSKFKSKTGSSKELITGESGKPDWSKVKEERKALREKRKAAQNADSFEVSIEAKKILETIRSRKCPAAEQIKQLQKLYSLLKGKLLSVVYAHDMSRVVETMLKLAHSHSQTDIFKAMFKELLPEVLEMTKRKYATHVVRFMIEHSQPAERAGIVKAYSGHLLKLLANKIGHVTLEQLYSKLKPEEQCFLQKELYGGSHKLITNETVTGLEVIFKSLPTMKESTLANTKENLRILFEKGAVQSRIVHSVLLDYLGFAKQEDVTEMLEHGKEHIKALVESKEGVNVAMMCVWMSNPKARKKIIKELKEAVVILACGEHTHMLLLAIFDTLDDTVIVQKAILTELLSGDLTPLLSNTYGRKVIMYLCSRRNPKMFTAPIIATLATGDKNPHSKKDPDVRASELQKFAVPLLLENIVLNTSLWMENNPNLLVLLEAVKVGSGDPLKSALDAIANFVTNPPNPKHMGIDIRIADNAGCHMTLKKLAQHDKVFKENGQATFGEALVPALTDQHYLTWLKNNRCCFLLLEILKSGSDEATKTLRAKIKSLSSAVWKKKEAIPEGGKRIQELL